MGVGVVGEKLETGVAIDALRARTRDGVCEGVGSDYARFGIAERTVGLYRVRRSSGLRLKVIARLTQMQCMRSYVAHLQHPLAAERVLDDCSTAPLWLQRRAAVPANARHS